MYPVSEAFLRAVQENTRRFEWHGKITTTAGVVHEFSQEDIVKGNGYITAQCCGSSEIELGTVYVQIAHPIDQFCGAKRKYQRTNVLFCIIREAEMGIDRIMPHCVVGQCTAEGRRC